MVVGDAVTFHERCRSRYSATELSFRWISDKDGDFRTGAINLRERYFSYSGLTADNHIITLAVEDKWCCLLDTTLLIVGTPLRQRLMPTDGEIFFVGETIIFRGTVSIHRISPMRLIGNSDIEGEPNRLSKFSGSQFTRSDHSRVFTPCLLWDGLAGLVADDLISFG